jgi:3-hydroxybutyryl-CoA dehydrogenase
MSKIKTGVVGSGAMGSGIAQVAATAGHEVILFDANVSALEKAKAGIESSLTKLVSKQKITAEEAKTIAGRIAFAQSISDFSSCGIIIEAIIEDIDIKKKLFTDLEAAVSDQCILATNTSSLSVTSIAGDSKNAARVVGIHFFNPATLMPLVEIIPGVQTT